MITIRRATRQDRDSIWRVHIQAIKEICKSHYTKDETQARSKLLKPGRYEKAIDSKALFVADDDDSIVGFGHLNLENGRIEALYVSPKYVGIGVGKKILQTLEHVAEQPGSKIVHVSSTLNAVSFYERAGYRSQGHSKHLLPSRLVTCILMAKELTS